MKPLDYFAVASQQVTQHRSDVLKLEVTLNANATAGLYLQIHDSSAVPANGAVPVKVWPASECAYKEFKRGELSLNVGCYVCLSTTAATKTLAAGGSDLMDILEVELSDPERPTGTTFVGDLSTGVTGRQVWTDAAGPKKLIGLEVDGTNLTTTCYIQLFAKDNPVNGDVPLSDGIFKIAAGAVKTQASAIRFGERGRDIQSVDATGLHKGCTVKISTTPSTLTLTGDSACIRAEYK